LINTTFCSRSVDRANARFAPTEAVVRWGRNLSRTVFTEATKMDVG
jgi:hypothetical protein